MYIHDGLISLQAAMTDDKAAVLHNLLCNVKVEDKLLFGRMVWGFLGTRPCKEHNLTCLFFRQDL